MQVITMLGTGKYDSATYSWNGRVFTTRLFPVALVEWLKPSDIHILLTQKAKENDHWKNLQEELNGKVTVHPMDIPDGATEKELWEIFDSMARITTGNPNEEFTLDITHGFRSLPVLTLLSAAFLRSAGRVRLSHILYGAYQAQDSETGTSPVFDLTPFLELLDWSAAAERFNDTGDSLKIANLLNDKHRQFYVNSSQMKGESKPVGFQRIGKTMENLSRALSLTLPREVLPEARFLLDKLDAAKEETRFAPPFGVVFDNIKRGYQSIALDTAHAKMKEILSGEWRLVQWYQERRQWAPMITLAREWIVSVVCYCNGLQIYDMDSRRRSEDCLNKASSCDLRVPEKAGKAWDEVAQFRNQISHCGMQRQKIPAKKLQTNIERTMESLVALAKENGMDG